MNAAQKDVILGSLTGVVALIYIAAARAIEDSLLADAVGAGGVPQAAGAALLLVALALLAKSWFNRKSPHAAPAAAVPRRLLVSAMLMAVLVAYVVLLPLLGYIAAVSLLVLAVALLAGARRPVPLALCTALSGIAMWAAFELLLKVRMPAGTLF